MPLFNNTPSTITSIQKARKERAIKKSLPIGVIGENDSFKYGYNGEYYYVTEGILEYYVTKMHLTFPEAKALFDALVFIGNDNTCSLSVTSTIKKYRKKDFMNKSLFWGIVDILS